jgi:hypothetical protein
MGEVITPRVIILRVLSFKSGILYIDAPTSSLNRHYGSEGPQRIISDLRGCRVDKVHSEDGQTLLVIKVSSTPGEVTLRPPMTDTEKWFAALYRWRSVTRSPSARSLQSTGSNKVTSFRPRDGSLTESRIVPRRWNPPLLQLIGEFSI